VTWSDAPNALVLTGGATISSDLEANYLHDTDEAGRFPFARVEADGFERDLETPGRIAVARFRVHVVAWAALFTNDADSLKNPDSHGGETVDGGTRDATQGQGKTTGRGLDEIVGRLVEALNDGVLVDSTHALQGEVALVGPTAPVFGSHFVKRVIAVEVYSATTRRQYHAVPSLAATNAGGGTVNLAWIAAPARYDSRAPIVRRGTNPGDAAPSSPSGGTSVTVLTATTAQATGLVTGQTYNFAVFVPYDETGSGSAERYSDPVSVSVST
jgi:hypothetical protein